MQDGFNWSLSGVDGSSPPGQGRSSPSPPPQPLDTTWQRAVAGRLEIGSTWGPFRIQDELGRGGMGVVYRALDLQGGREVALKVHSKRMTMPQLIRFQREGELTANLKHPGIVGIHSAGEVGGVPFLAYELMSGPGSFRTILDQRPLPRERAVSMLAEIAAALGYAHSQGVIHRDIKPDNVLLDGQGRPRLADFGLALADSSQRMTQTGAMLGTPTYMSPEQLSGSRDEVGPASDVWSLGVMLYEALTGELPFRGETLMELAMQIAGADPQPPRQLDPGVPRALQSICLRALEPRPQDRYLDGGDMAADLGRYLAGQEVIASREGFLRRRLRRAWRSRRARVLAFGLLLVLGIFSGAAVLLGRLGPGGPDPGQVLREALSRGADSDELERALADAREAGVSPELRGAGWIQVAERREGRAGLEASQRARALLPGDSRARLVLAERRLELGDREGARTLLRSLAEESGSLARPLVLRLGQSLLRADLAASAVTVGERLVAEEGTDSGSWQLLVAGLLAQGEVAEARRRLEALEGRDLAWSVLLEAQLVRSEGGDDLALLRREVIRSAGEVAVQDVLTARLVEAGELREADRWCQRWQAEEVLAPAMRERARFLKALVEDTLPNWRAVVPAIAEGGRRWLVAEQRREVALAERLRIPQPSNRRISAPPPPELHRGRVQALARRVAASRPPREIARQSDLLALRGLAERDPAAAQPIVARLLGREPELPAGRLWRAVLDPNPEDLEAALTEPELLRQRRLAAAAGRVLLALGRAQEAVPLLRRAFEPERLDADVGELLGQALTATGRAGEAQEVNERVRRLRGSRREEAQQLCRRARHELKSAPSEDRIELLERCLELDPLLFEALFHSGKIGLRTTPELQGNLRKLIVGMTRALWMLQAELIETFLEAGRLGGDAGLQQAAQNFDPEREPLERGILLTAVYEHSDAGDEALAREALALMNLELERNPGQVVAYLTRGFLHLRQGLPAQAERDLGVAYEQSPATAAFYVGLLEAAQGAPPEQVLARLREAREGGFPKLTRRQLGHYAELERLLRFPSFAEKAVALFGGGR